MGRLTRGLMACAFLAALAAQPSAVSIRGRVTSPDGAPVAGAKVVARSPLPSASFVTNTDPNGDYHFRELAAGSYVIQVSHAGFAEVSKEVRTVTGVELHADMSLGLSPVRSEVTVSAEAGSAEDLGLIPLRGNVIHREEWSEKPGDTVAASVVGQQGLDVQRTAPAMGSIFIRGLTGRNVAVYRDGIRYTTAAQRGGISSFLNLNGAAGLESIEVQRGPASALYGSDALGGAVNLISKVPSFSENRMRIHEELGLFYRSVSNGFGARSTTEFEAERFAVTLIGAGARENPVHVGQDRDTHGALVRYLGLASTLEGSKLPDTAYTPYNATLQFQYCVSPRDFLSVHYERGQQDGVRRHDQLLGGDGNLIAEVAGLQMDFGYLRYQRLDAAWLDRISVSGSFNRQREERINQGGSGDPLAAVAHEYERTTVWGLQGLVEKRVGHHSLAAGYENYWEGVDAPAYQYSPVTRTTRTVRGRIPNGASYMAYGGYIQDAWQALSALRVSLAFRVGGASYAARAADNLAPGGDPLWPNDSFHGVSWTGRAGVLWQMKGPFSLYGQYSRGYRAPNVTDLGSLGLQGNGNFETAAQDLVGRDAFVGTTADASAVSSGIPVTPIQAETAENGEGGIQVRNASVSFELGAFYMSLKHAITTRSLVLPQGQVGKPLGGQIITQQLTSGVVYVPSSTRPVAVRSNTGGANFTGVEERLQWKLQSAWSLTQTFTWLRAADQSTGLPPDIEPGTPAPIGYLKLLWSPPQRRAWLEAYVGAAGRQTRLSTLALGDRRIGASRSRSDIARFFRNGAAVRGYVQNGILVMTGETLPQVQQRVLGNLDAAPLYKALPGYAVFGLRGGFPVTKRSRAILGLENLLDASYRGMGWGTDAPGRSVNVQWIWSF